ncbi:MAG TPA: hypothetical protein VF746_30025 [Longimicrobium sp.]
MANNKKGTAKGATAKRAGKGGSEAVQRGGSSVPRSDNGRFVSKNDSSEKGQISNPYAGLTKLVGKVRVRDPYTSEFW